MLPVLAIIVSVALAGEIPPVHEQPVEISVKNGQSLTLTISQPSNIWHRVLNSDGTKEYVEECNEYLDVCQKWRSGDMGKNISPSEVKVSGATLQMPKVTPADSGSYFTYVREEQGRFHYKYFNVTVTA